jgi:hypothetical protein
MKRIAAAVIIVLAATAKALATTQPVPHLPVPKDAAVILNTGSTNTTGYRIVVESSGRAQYVQGSTRGTARISSTIAATFFADLEKAMPLSHLRVEPCMKSASFGSMTFVWWHGQRSPDISCPGDGAAAALFEDAGTIAGALHLSGGHMIRMLPNEPRKPLPASSPSPSPMRASE